jgi:hypothetical protein
MLLIIMLVPGIFFMATRYGAVGAAAVWVALTSIYMLIGVPLTHRRLLKGETRRWFTEDVGLPLAGAIPVAWVGRELMVTPRPPIVAIVSLSIVLLGALAAAAFAAPHTRVWLLTILSHFLRSAVQRARICLELINYRWLCSFIARRRP